MKCKNCKYCSYGWLSSKPNKYVCIGVKEPFVIENIEQDCTEYNWDDDKEETKIMSNNDFVNFIKKEICDYTNKHIDKTDSNRITTDDVYIVWICKTLQNHKALVSTTLPDGMYYEITYNGDKNEAYIDAYKKWENYCVKF